MVAFFNGTLADKIGQPVGMYRAWPDVVTVMSVSNHLSCSAMNSTKNVMVRIRYVREQRIAIVHSLAYTAADYLGTLFAVSSDTKQYKHNVVCGLLFVFLTP